MYRSGGGGGGSPSASQSPYAQNLPQGSATSGRSSPIYGGQGNFRTARLSFLPPGDQDRYEQLFLQLSPGLNNNVTGEQARSILMQSQLPNDVLGHIWTLADIDSKGVLSFPEFCLAMFLAACRVAGKDVPFQLPDQIRHEVRSAMAMLASNSLMMTGNSNVNQHSMGIGMSRSGSQTSLALSPYSGSDSDVSAVYAGAQSATGERLRWAVGPQEKSTYDQIFKVWDNGTGYISGDKAREIFSASNVPQASLAQIWMLSDIHNHGKLNQDEFAVAMHLIYATLNGQSIPSVLPPELIPPSTRQLSDSVSSLKQILVTDILTKKTSTPILHRKIQPSELKKSSSATSLSSTVQDDVSTAYVSSARRKGAGSANSSVGDVSSRNQTKETRNGNLNTRKDFELAAPTTMQQSEATRSIHNVLSKASHEPSTMQQSEATRSIHNALSKVSHEPSRLNGSLEKDIRDWELRLTSFNSTVGAISNYEAHSPQSMDDVNNLLERFPEMLNQARNDLRLLIEKQLTTVVEKESNLRPESGDTAAMSEADRIKAKAAAMLAERMAKLGIQQPPSQKPIFAAPVDSFKMEHQRRACEQEKREIEIQRTAKEGEIRHLETLLDSLKEKYESARKEEERIELKRQESQASVRENSAFDPTSSLSTTAENRFPAIATSNLTGSSIISPPVLSPSPSIAMRLASASSAAERERIVKEEGERRLRDRQAQLSGRSPSTGSFSSPVSVASTPPASSFSNTNPVEDRLARDRREEERRDAEKRAKMLARTREKEKKAQGDNDARLARPPPPPPPPTVTPAGPISYASISSHENELGKKAREILAREEALETSRRTAELESRRYGVEANIHGEEESAAKAASEAKTRKADSHENELTPPAPITLPFEERFPQIQPISNETEKIQAHLKREENASPLGIRQSVRGYEPVSSQDQSERRNERAPPPAPPLPPTVTPAEPISYASRSLHEKQLGEKARERLEQEEALETARRTAESESRRSGINVDRGDAESAVKAAGEVKIQKTDSHENELTPQAPVTMPFGGRFPQVQPIGDEKDKIQAHFKTEDNILAAGLRGIRQSVKGYGWDDPLSSPEEDPSGSRNEQDEWDQERHRKMKEENVRHAGIPLPPPPPPPPIVTPAEPISYASMSSHEEALGRKARERLVQEEALETSRRTAELEGRRYGSKANSHGPVIETGNAARLAAAMFGGISASKGTASSTTVQPLSGKLAASNLMRRDSVDWLDDLASDDNSMIPKSPGLLRKAGGNEGGQGKFSPTMQRARDALAEKLAIRPSAPPTVVPNQPAESSSVPASSFPSHAGTVGAHPPFPLTATTLPVNFKQPQSVSPSSTKPIFSQPGLSVKPNIPTGLNPVSSPLDPHSIKAGPLKEMESPAHASVHISTDPSPFPFSGSSTQNSAIGGEQQDFGKPSSYPVMDVFSDSESYQPLTPTEANPASAKLVSAQFRYSAIYGYSGSRQDDLSFAAGDVIIVDASAATDEEDWWFGQKERDGTSGYFPRIYVALEDASGKNGANVLGSPTQAAPRILARVLYDFVATAPDELSIEEGQVVVVLNKECDAGWWKVEAPGGAAEGIVPASYVQELSEDDALASTDYSVDAETMIRAQSFDTLAPIITVVSPMTKSAPALAPSPVAKAGINSKSGGLSNGQAGKAVSSIALSIVPLDERIAEQENQGPTVQSWMSIIDREQASRFTSEERKRQEAIFELILTEQTYLRDLQLIVEVFYASLQCMLSQEDMRSIFANLDEILLCNTQLLSELEARQVDDGFIVGRIGDVFLRHTDALKVYLVYCGNQMSASTILQKFRKLNPKLAEFLKQCQRNPKCRNLDLSSFLLSPMQRITRYPLLLRQILHYTPKDHEDHPAIVQALDAAEHALDATNEAARERENMARLKQISQVLDLDSLHGRLDLLGTTRSVGKRQLILEGPLTKTKSGRRLYAYLFNDLLILGEPIRAAHVKGYEYGLYRDPMPLNEIAFRDIPATKPVPGADETCFQIVHIETIITLRASTISIKRKWMNAVEAATSHLVNVERAHRFGANPSASTGGFTNIGTLQVLICEGQHLCSGATASMEKYAANAYCIVQLGRQQLKTKVIKGSSSPKWNQSLILSVPSLDETLKITVYGYDKYSQDEYLGQAGISLDFLEYYCGKETEIITLKLADVPTGSIRLQLTYKNS